MPVAIERNADHRPSALSSLGGTGGAAAGGLVPLPDLPDSDAAGPRVAGGLEGLVAPQGPAQLARHLLHLCPEPQSRRPVHALGPP